MFNVSSVWPSYDVIRKLCSGIPNKTKLVVGGWWPAEKLSETLQVTVPSYHRLRQFLTLLLDILNKRWQTLDLVSMMDEFKRSAYPGERLIIMKADTLSSLPRFNRERDLS